MNRRKALLALAGGVVVAGSGLRAAAPEEEKAPMPFKAVLGSKDLSATVVIGTGEAGGARDGLADGLAGPGSDPAPPKSRPEGTLLPLVIAGKVSVQGNLDKATVTRITRRYLSGIRWCYQDALQRNAKLAGKVTLSFVILTNGRVSNPSTSKSSIKDKQLLSCMTNKTKRWKFPSPKGGGIVKVSAPLTLKLKRKPAPSKLLAP